MDSEDDRRMRLNRSSPILLKGCKRDHRTASDGEINAAPRINSWLIGGPDHPFHLLSNVGGAEVLNIDIGVSNDDPVRNVLDKR